MPHRIKKRKHGLEIAFVFFCLLSVLFSFGGMKSISILVANIGALLFLIAFIYLNPYEQNPKAFALPRWSWGALILWIYSIIQILPIYTQHTTSSHDLIYTQLQIEVWPSISLTPLQSLYQGALFLIWFSIALSSALIERRKRWVLFLLIALGSINALIGWIHMFFQADRIFGIYEIAAHRALTGYFGIFVNQNTGSALMLMSCILLLAFTFSYQKYAMIWLSLFALNLSGMIASDSRSALLSLALFASLLTIALLKEKRFLVFSCGLLVALGIWLSLIFLKSFGFQSEIKFQILKDSLVYLSDYWLLGSGKGSFSHLFSQYQHFYIPHLWVSHAENAFIEIFCEMGLIGFLFGIIWFVYHLLSWGYLFLKSAHLTAIALYLSIWAICYQQCFDLGFSGMGLSIPFSMAVGLLWSYVPPQKSITLARMPLIIFLSLLVTLYIVSISLWKYVDDYPLDLLSMAKTSNEVTKVKNDQKSVMQKYLPYRSHDGILIAEYAKKQLIHQYQAIKEKKYSQILAWSDVTPWIKRAKFLAPANDLPYYLDGKMLLLQGLDELAVYSFYQAIKINPLKAKDYFNEINHSKMDPWQAVPENQYFSYLCDLDEKKQWSLAEKAIISHLHQLNLQSQRLSIKICGMTKNFSCLDRLQTLINDPKDLNYILSVKSALNGDLQTAHSYLRALSKDDQEIKGQLKLTLLLFQRFSKDHSKANQP